MSKQQNWTALEIDRLEGERQDVVVRYDRNPTNTHLLRRYRRITERIAFLRQQYAVMDAEAAIAQYQRL